MLKELDSTGAYLDLAFVLKNSPFSYRICSVVGVYGIYDSPPFYINDAISNPHLILNSF